MRTWLVVTILVLTGCGGQADDVYRAPPGGSLTRPRAIPDPASAACECWEGDGWTPRPAAGCTNLR